MPLHTGSYRHNKALARTKNTKPTETDQSQAKATDLNVIVKKFGVSVGSKDADPRFGMDLTKWPKDLRETFEVARGMREAKKQLPPQLAGLSLNELLTLTDADLAAKLKPSDQPADEPKDEPK